MNAVFRSPLATSFHASPNFNGRKGKAISHIILHYTGMQSGEAALARLCDPQAEVSAHYVVFQEGQITQCVDENMRAWHAGLSCWQGERDMNSTSIGVEIVNKGHEWGYEEFPPAQIEALISLCQDIKTRHALPKHNILGHSDIAPKRKEDPGEKFPWGMLATHGLGFPLPVCTPSSEVRYALHDEGLPVRALQSLFARFGYDCPINGVYEAETQSVVRAFQRHFRPTNFDGVLDGETLAVLKFLLELR
jgi:N-acetylmuramoyl-L-alanine amidase